MDTPYQWTKQVASHWGGTRNGAIVHWPKGIKERGEVRSQFSHVIDLAPTVFEAAGLPEPTASTASSRCRCTAQAWTLIRRPDAPSIAQTQYFEMFANRGIYHRRLDCGDQAQHPLDHDDAVPAFDDDVWELYAPDDWTQSHDLSGEQPEQAARAPAPLPDRGGQVQRLARSTTGGWSVSTPTSRGGPS